MKIFTWLPVFAWACLAALQADAQLSFSLPTINNASTGQTVNLPLTVDNFDSIVAMQFVISWDPAVLQFKAVNNLNLPDLDDKDFNLDETGSGIIRIAWVGPVGGVSKPNGTAIFNLRMEVVGAQNSGTPVNITELPPLTFFEVTKLNGATLGINDVVIHNGFVAVGYVVAAKNPETKVSTVQVYPNPVNARSKVYFTLERSERVVLQWIDAAGRLLDEQAHFLYAGKHGMEIGNAKQNQPGLPSWLVLIIGNRREVLPLIGF